MPKRYTKEIFIIKAKKIHGDRYDYSLVKYKNSSTHIIIICSIHGQFKQIPGDHINNKAGCSKCKGVKRLTQKEFIDKSISIHGNKYDYSKVKYINSKTKVTIICSNHGEFIVTPNHHQRGIGCMKCGRIECAKKTSLGLNKFIENARSVHGDRYDYSESIFKNTVTKIAVICKSHGVFMTMPYNHITNKSGCPVCVGRIKMTKEEFVRKARRKHGNKFDYSKIKNISLSKKIPLKCNDCKRSFDQLTSNHLKGVGCAKCSGVALSTTDDFIIKAKIVHGDNKYDYSEVKYISNRTKVLISCLQHGNFKQSPNSHLRGAGCPRCFANYSKKQVEWIKYLSITKNIVSICSGNEYTIPGTRYKVDGYDPDTNTIYEFHGDFWHGNPKYFNLKAINRVNKKSFGRLFNITMKKEILIKKLGYTYVCIWQSEWDRGINAIKKIQRRFKGIRKGKLSFN